MKLKNGTMYSSSNEERHYYTALVTDKKVYGGVSYSIKYSFDAKVWDIENWNRYFDDNEHDFIEVEVNLGIVELRHSLIRGLFNGWF